MLLNFSESSRFPNQTQKTAEFRTLRIPARFGALQKATNTLKNVTKSRNTKPVLVITAGRPALMKTRSQMKITSTL